ncbi:MAG: hypothetical protein ABS938_00045 [Psychrobacillus psychrodurans]
MTLERLSKNDILKMETEQVYTHLANALKAATDKEELTAEEKSVYKTISEGSYLTAFTIYNNLLECRN